MTMENKTITGKDIIHALIDGHKVKIVKANGHNHLENGIVDMDETKCFWTDTGNNCGTCQSLYDFWQMINKHEVQATIYKEPKFKDACKAKLEFSNLDMKYVYVWGYGFDSKAIVSDSLQSARYSVDEERLTKVTIVESESGN